MTRALAIFRKDVRHLWLEALIFPALLAVVAAIDPVYIDYKLHFAITAACWYIIVRVIHQEPLPGDRQYWLTRPYTWRDLLVAKALFLALFLIAPFALFHAVTWQAMGIPPLEHLHTLFWKVVFFKALYIVPAAAIAALTRNMAHAILAGLIIGVSWILGQVFQMFELRADDWLITAVLAAVLLICATAIVLLQYWLRRTGVLRGFAAAVLALALAVNFSMTRARAFALGSVLYPRPAQPALRISSDAGATSVPDRYNHLQVQIPIQIEGVPSGLELFVNGVSANVDGVFPPHTSLTTGSLTLYYDYGPQPDLSSGFLDVRGAAELTLFRRRDATPLAPTGRTVVRGLGACSLRPDADGKPNVLCYSPHPRLSLFVQSRAWDANWIVPRGFITDPLPAARIFEPLNRYHSQLSAENPDDFAGALLVSGEPVSHLSLDFHFTGVPVRPSR